MAEIPVQALDARQQNLLAKAQAALEQGDAEYAIAACAEILAATPGCVPVRRLHRAAQLKRVNAINRLVRKVWARLRAVSFQLGANRRTPVQSFAAAERVLALDPTNVSPLKQLASAAQALGDLETAVFAGEAARELRPDDPENLIALGEALLGLGRFDEALAALEVVVSRHPAHPDAQAVRRRVLIAQTVARGQWEDSGSFREKLKP